MDRQRSDTVFPPLHPGGDLGWRVHLRRNALGLSREELAARAGMAADYVSFIEERAAEPDANAVIALARALGLSREQLRGAMPASQPAVHDEKALDDAP